MRPTMHASGEALVPKHACVGLSSILQALNITTTL
jgi:hypothetical protein